MTECTPTSRPLARNAPKHTQWLLQGIIEKLSARPDLLGLPIAGSFLTNQMDNYSDLDLKVVADPGQWETVREARKRIAASVGPQ